MELQQLRYFIAVAETRKFTTPASVSCFWHETRATFTSRSRR